MTILVTGGAGYIGSHAIKNLKKQGYSVVAIDNLILGHKEFLEVLKVPLIIGEISDKNLIRKILKGEYYIKKNQKVDKIGPISAVMHFAAFTNVGESVTNPLKYYKNNVCDSFSLLEAIVEENFRRDKYKSNNLNQIPFVFSSTCATYGIPNKIPINEETQQNPINPYGKGKLIIENFLNDFGKAYKLKSIIFRYFNVAGADPLTNLGELHIPETHLIPLIFDTILGRREQLEIYGDNYPTKDGTCIRDFIHVEDLVNAHILGLNQILNNGEFNSNFTNVFNLGNGSGYSVKEIIEAVEKITKKNVPIKISKRRSGDPPILISSSKKAFEELNWVAKYSDINQIIEDAWKWHNKIYGPLK